MHAGKVKELEEKLAELKLRIPPHSVPPTILQQIEELEEEIAKLKQVENEG